MEIETGRCGVYRGIHGLGVSMNHQNECQVTIVDSSGGQVDQTITQPLFFRYSLWIVSPIERIGP
jgi:hypothetical protein